MRTTLRAGCIASLALAASLQAQAPLPPGTWRLADAPAAVRNEVSHADLIIVSMQDALLRELTGSLSLGGPDLAVNSCHVDLIGAIRRVSRQPGVEAGRTSDRLRNRTNVPRDWAAPLVEANAGRLAREVDGFVVDLGDKVGVLRSIAHQPVCAGCHGPGQSLTPGVRAALTARYPADRAIGFKNGEIRGWFWVEVPKKPH
jgi:hypothetical protein